MGNQLQDIMKIIEPAYNLSSYKVVEFQNNNDSIIRGQIIPLNKA